MIVAQRKRQKPFFIWVPARILGFYALIPADGALATRKPGQDQNSIPSRAGTPAS